MSELSRTFLASRPSMSTGRAAAVENFIEDLEVLCANVQRFDDRELRAFLDSKLAAGFHRNTVRKWLVMARSLANWMYAEGTMSADTLLAIRGVRAPEGSSRRPQPQPCTRAEIRDLRAVLDERWPRMADDKARHYALRWREGRTSYSRIRRHAIRLQLDAVIALALQLCLRRREILGLDLNCVSPDNAYVVVAGFGVQWTERARAVPYTVSARTALADWLAYRRLLGADHDRPWVALYAAPTVGQPMKADAFDTLLRTYVGSGWSLKRLRDTGAARWVDDGMSVEHLRRLLGLSAVEDTLPYAQLAAGDVEERMHTVEARPLLSLAA
jgi:site-specific recombinase XerD